MRVDDGIDVRTLAIDPYMEARGGVGPPPAGQRFQILIHQHHALRIRFVEPIAELQRPPGPGLFAARRDLAGEPGLVSFGGEDAAGAGKRFLGGKGSAPEIKRHLAVDALDEMFARLHFMSSFHPLISSDWAGTSR